MAYFLNKYFVWEVDWLAWLEVDMRWHLLKLSNEVSLVYVLIIGFYNCGKIVRNMLCLIIQNSVALNTL